LRSPHTLTNAVTRT